MNEWMALRLMLEQAKTEYAAALSVARTWRAAVKRLRREERAARAEYMRTGPRLPGEQQPRTREEAGG